MQPAAGTSFEAIEIALTAIALGLAFLMPRLGSRWFEPMERALGKLAMQRGWAVTIVGLAAFLGRLALLPLCPIPQPFVPDDFSFLLAANTFAMGRLTNPTPAMWTHFESIHICMNPSYMSMYFPAQGLILTLGRALTGNAWFGLLFISALMCASLCWMLQAWIPSRWALFGGMLAVMHLSLFSYWINTYSGAGCVTALGGALVLGALPRIMRNARLRDALLLSLGMIILILSRPFEGMLVCVPVGFALGRWMLIGKNRPKPAFLIRRALLPVAMLLAAALWLGYYDLRVNDNPLTLPYTVNRATYAIAPYWIWQRARPIPNYRHKVMRDFYAGVELPLVQKMHTWSGFLFQLATRPIVCTLFFFGVALLPPLMLLPRVLRDRRIRFFVFAGVFWAAGMLIQIFLLPHYLAAFTAAIYVVALQAMRHARQFQVGSTPVGVGMMRFTVVVCMALIPIRALAGPLHLTLAPWPGSAWNFDWYGPGAFGETRAKVAHNLESLPGKQLVLVRYSNQHAFENEWVYNEPEIDGSRVVWAREMDAPNNLELMRYYKDRTVWLVQPDVTPVSVSPYPIQQAISATVEAK